MLSESGDKVKRIVTRIDEIVIGPKFLTKYEKARIVAVRAMQLAQGAKPLIDVSKLDTKDPVLIAIKELESGVLPFVIKRETPNGEYQLIPVKILIEHEKKKKMELAAKIPKTLVES